MSEPKSPLSKEELAELYRLTELDAQNAVEMTDSERNRMIELSERMIPGFLADISREEERSGIE